METTGFNTGSLFIGKKMQHIEVQTTHGVKIIPDDYMCKWIILFCRPGAFTLSCIKEFYEFAKRDKEFKKLNTEIVGLSTDLVTSNIKCIRWIKQYLKMKIPFPIITNDMRSVEELNGTIHSGKGTNMVRAVSIIDPEGIIRLMIYYPQKKCTQFDEILRALEALQISGKEKVAMS